MEMIIIFYIPITITHVFLKLRMEFIEKIKEKKYTIQSNLP